MKNQPKQSIYSQMQQFANVTKTLIMQGNLKRAKKGLQIAQNLFNKEIRNAIVNVYIFSISTFRDSIIIA